MMARSSSRFLTAACLAGLVGSGSALAANPNLVLNGGFEQTLVNVSSQFGSLYPSQQVTGWSTAGYSLLYKSGTADTTGAIGNYGVTTLWGPNNGSSNGLPASSPSGGNYVAADGGFEVSPISQTISGLASGQRVEVSFYWAGAQEYGYNGASTEKWQVTLGSTTQSTPVVNNVSHGFTGWVYQTLTFVTTVANPVLSFLAVGTPSGQPPFVLLDGVSVTVVPEPATGAILIASIAGLIGLARRRRAEHV